LSDFCGNGRLAHKYGKTPPESAIAPFGTLLHGSIQSNFME
jgi:hypothetical protein